MEPVFISVGVMVGALLLIAYYVQNGVGGMSQPLQTGPFPARQGPAGAVDVFDDSAGRGGRVGPFRPCVAGSRGDPRFRGPLARLGRHRARLSGQPRLVLRRRQRVGDDDQHDAAHRSGDGVHRHHPDRHRPHVRRAPQQRSQRLDDGLVFTGVSLLVLLLPTLAGLFGMDAATEDLLSKVVSSVVLHTVVGGALLVNVLITLANRGDAPIAYTSWFLVNALVVMLVAPLLYIGGELGSGTQTVWLAQAALEGWLPLALMLGTAYAVIPAASERAIWSSSLATASSPCSSSPCLRCRCVRWTPPSCWRTLVAS